MLNTGFTLFTLTSLHTKQMDKGAEATNLIETLKKHFSSGALIGDLRTTLDVLSSKSKIDVSVKKDPTDSLQGCCG